MVGDWSASPVINIQSEPRCIPHPSIPPHSGQIQPLHSRRTLAEFYFWEFGMEGKLENKTDTDSCTKLHFAQFIRNSNANKYQIKWKECRKQPFTPGKCLLLKLFVNIAIQRPNNRPRYSHYDAEEVWQERMRSSEADLRTGTLCSGYLSWEARWK